jgi:hypothetical protein
MTTAMLIRSDTTEDRFREASLDDALRALPLLGVGECLVCGAVVQVAADGHIDCPACGSVLEAPARRRDQLAMV